MQGIVDSNHYFFYHAHHPFELPALIDFDLKKFKKEDKPIFEKFNRSTGLGADWKRIAPERHSDCTEGVAADSVRSTQFESQPDRKNRNDIRTNGKPFSPDLKALR
ncbi:MAG: hypothetical protein AB1Z20_05770 [Desulfobacterales bacterium]